MGKSRLVVISTIFSLVIGLAAGSQLVASAKSKSSGKSKASKKSSSGKSVKSSKKSKTAKGGKSSRKQKSQRVGKKMSKKERAAARRAAAAARRRELERLAAIRRYDEMLRTQAALNIAADNVANEDPFVRSVSLSALGSRAGTVVVMDPNNGRVLSIVNQRMAIGSALKPCSTIKPFVALAALNEHLMDESAARTLRTCNCEMEMDDALAYSNNEYFQQLGRQLGLQKVNEYEREFGLGQVTGINLAGETPGHLPTDDSAESGRIYSHGDGVGLTAIQLASFVSTIANGGSLFQPQVVAPGHTFTPVLRRQIRIDPKNRTAVLEGMTGAVDYGTAKRAYDEEEHIAGKTGTCIGNGSWLGLFASFAGVDRPNLVVVVITQGSSSRGKYAADIAGQIYKGLASRYGTTASRPRRTTETEVQGVPTLGNR